MDKLKKTYRKWRQKIIFCVMSCFMTFTTAIGGLLFDKTEIFAANNISIGVPNTVYATGESHRYLVNNQYYPTVSFTTGGTTEWGFLQDFMINGEVVFCIEPLVKTHNGYDYVVGNINTKLNASQQAYMSNIAWYGYGYNGDTSDLNKYATEVLIWENCGVQVGNITAELRNKVNEIRNLIASSTSKPSFHNSIVEINGYGKENAITITDTNGVINSWSNNIFSSNGYHVEKNGNNVTVWADVGVKQNGSASLLQGTNRIVWPQGQQVKHMICYISPSNAQTITRLGDPNYGSSNLTLKIARGSLELTKVNEVGNLLDGAVFNLKSITPGIDYDQNIVVKNGRIKVDDLIVGDYILTEVSVPDKHVMTQAVYEVTVKPNETTEQIVVNKLKPTGNIVLNKTLEKKPSVTVEETEEIKIDYSLIEFGLYAKEDIYDSVTLELLHEKGALLGEYGLDKNGTLEITGLPMGKYVLKEICTLDGYVLNTKEYEVIFRQEDYVTKEYTYELNVENKITKVAISKQDITSHKELKGATLKVLDESNNVVEEWISTDKPHMIYGLSVGKKYFLEETIAPDGYQLATSKVEFTVENIDNIQGVTMYNEMIPPIVNTSDPNLNYAIINVIVCMVAWSVIVYLKENRKRMNLS